MDHLHQPTIYKEGSWGRRSGGVGPGTATVDKVVFGYARSKKVSRVFLDETRFASLIYF